ncbi:hypothetical protein BASA81_007770 [Batrachochytrium salamandrivorans]|nr:hypothetical protein BASA81_007770 [Batrachochytrium salamandrivorans]
MGASLTRRSADPATELRFAAQTGQVQKCLKLCLTHAQLDLDTGDASFGLTALHLSLFSGPHTASRFLHDTAGLPPGDVCLLEGKKTSRQAVAIAKLLLERGASVEAREKRMGFTPLHFASCYGNAELVSLLLSHGAQDCQDRFGKTPLHWASQNGHAHVCRLLLLAKGNRVDAVDVHLRTALHWAAAYGNALVCQILLEHGARVNLMDSKGYTPVHLAVRFGHLECLPVLRRYELWYALLAVQSSRQVPRLSGPKCAVKRLPNELFYLITRALI